MKRVNFITNLDLNEISGGGSSINAATYQILSQYFDVNYVGPINPSSDYSAKIFSKMLRVAGRPGNFHFFSNRRLQAISEEVSKKVDKNADFDFFHGPTSWILYHSPRPYYVYLDACFSTYLDVFHDKSNFIKRDVERICKIEAKWLKNATQVFFRSQWALEETAKAYSLPTENFQVTGRGVNMIAPEKDIYKKENFEINFLFVAANEFERKGGRICCEAFKKFRQSFPDSRLFLIGVEPPSDVLQEKGIEYCGFLKKSVPEELKKLRKLFSEAFALIHPTSFDTNPLVITETGYFGCPAIASKSFGIPELIKDGITGFLVDPPLKSDDFTERMLELCRDHTHYLAMRNAVRSYTTTEMTWDAVGNRMAQEITASLEKKRALQ